MLTDGGEIDGGVLEVMKPRNSFLPTAVGNVDQTHILFKTPS